MFHHDPASVYKLDPEALARARHLGLHPIHIICDEPGAKPGEHTAVTFLAFVAFVPQVGEIIKLEDGKSCQVHKVVHKQLKDHASGLISLTPNVHAVQVAS
jgi:hypothetical protein